MTARATSIVFVAFGVACVACLHKDDDKQRVVAKDDGQICLGTPILDDADAGGLAAVHEGAPLDIVVRSGCLSDACATKRASSCSVKRDGDTLVVSSEMSWTAPEDIGSPCKGTCRPIEVKCAAPDPIPAGNYVVAFGPNKTNLVVPSQVPSPCAGAREVPRPAVVASASASAAAPAASPAPIDTVAAMNAPPPATGAPPPEPLDVMCVKPLHVPKKGKIAAKAAPVAITITQKNRCEGMSCSAAVPKCKAKRQGSVIVVDAQMPAAGAKPRKPCTDDCPPIEVSCKTDPIPLGTYTIEWGTRREISFTMPVGASGICTH